MMKCESVKMLGNDQSSKIVSCLNSSCNMKGTWAKFRRQKYNQENPNPNL